MTFVSPWPIRFHDRMKLECSPQRIPRAVVLGLLELNCDWPKIPTSQKSFPGSGSQTLCSAETSDSRKYVCVRRLPSQWFLNRIALFMRTSATYERLVTTRSARDNGKASGCDSKQHVFFANLRANFRFVPERASKKNLREIEVHETARLVYQLRFRIK